MKKQFLLLTVLLFLLGACAPKPAEHSFIKVNADGQFVRDGKPYYFVGTNFWYGAILGSEGEGGNRERLHKELDFLKSIGINNLRVLVGADGENGIKTRVEPSLQVAPGVYNDTILAGLDYFMNELRERDMTAVLYLNNSWEWSRRRMARLYGVCQAVPPIGQREGLVCQSCQLYCFTHQ